MHEHTIQHTATPRGAMVGAGGAMLIGAVVGMQADAESGTQLGALLHATSVLPLILAGVSAAMIPALYIAMSLAGAAPPAPRVAAALMRAFGACGVTLLGLAAPLAFLLSTMHSSHLSVLLGAAVVAAGVIAGLRVIFADLFGGRAGPLVHLVFALWSLVSLAIGARMYTQLMLG